MLNSEDYMKIFHEIKNNITLINSYLQLLEKKHPEVASFHYWSDSMNEVARLRTIVTELSQVKLGNGLKPESVNICEFVDEVCQSVCCTDEKKGVRYCLTHTAGTLTAFVDPKQLRLAILNLIKNSCEAMNQTGTIFAETGLERNMVSIRLTDTGGGLPPEIEEHIYDPFATTKENGSGLGLVITRQIVEAHNGTILCESRPGDGCTFTILLPSDRP